MQEACDHTTELWKARWRTRLSLTLEFVLHVQADEFSLPLQRWERYVDLCITAADKPP